MRSFLIVTLLSVALLALGQEGAGTYSAYGDVGDKHFRSTVSFEDIRKTPPWSPAAQEVPPLPPGRAQAIARRQLDRIVSSTSDWHVDEVRIVAAADDTHWLYEVSFRREYPPDALVVGEHVDLLVLMDGTSPDPKVIPRPGPDHPTLATPR